jgi:imidazolonepropionase-like amidohydrolase
MSPLCADFSKCWLCSRRNSQCTNFYEANSTAMSLSGTQLIASILPVGETIRERGTPMAEEQLLAVTAARLVDGTGGPPLEDPVVLVQGERIRHIFPRGQDAIPAGATVHDLGAATLLPGLIDAHVHFYRGGSNSWVLRSFEPPQRKLIRGIVDAGQLLQNGFTAVREMGNRDSIFIKQAIQAGEISGPRMVAARKIIVQTGGSPDPYWLPVEWVQQYDYRCRLADGVDDVRKAAREQLREGADFLKIMTSGGLTTRAGVETSYHYTLEEIRAVVEEGHKVGVKVAAHAIGAAAAKNAVRAGADTLEHGAYLDNEALDLMAEHDVIFVPTLSINHVLAHSGLDGEMAHTVRGATAMVEDALRQVERARQRGVRIAAGTDFGGIPVVRHGPNALEAELLTQAGLAPAEAIVSITRRGAEAMDRLDEIGTVEPGKYADLVATETNPLDDIRALQAVRFVMQGGSVIRDDLTVAGRDEPALVGSGA